MARLRINKWLILVLLALAQFMVVLDVSVVNVALPSIQQTFNLSSANLQWIITAYTLLFGGFLLLGGRSADLFGRRRTFLAGVIVFTLASLGTGLSTSGGVMIAFRAIQGIAAAFMSPSALSMVLVTFKEGRERNVALAVWGAVASAGAAAGVLIGGILTQYFGWRWNFFVNVPVGIFLVITSLLVLDEYRSVADNRSLDLTGVVSVTSGLILLVFSIVEAPTLGWGEPLIVSYLIIGTLLLAIFVVNEALTPRPLMPLEIFSIPNVAAANFLMLLMAATVFSAFFFSTLYLQIILGFSPIKTGISFIAVPLAIALAASNVPRIIKRVGYKPILMVAPLIVSAGLFWASFITVNGTYFRNMLPAFILIGLGMGALFISTTIAATSGLPPQESGLASGLLVTSQQVGGSLGIAVLTSIATSSTLHYLHSSPSLSSGVVAAATVHGFHMAFLVASGFGLLASLAAALFIHAQPVPVEVRQTEVSPQASASQ